MSELQMENEKKRLLEEFSKYSLSKLVQATEFLKFISEKEKDSTEEVEFVEIPMVLSLEKNRCTNIDFVIKKMKLQEYPNQKATKKTQTQFSIKRQENVNSNLSHEIKRKKINNSPQKCILNLDETTFNEKSSKANDSSNELSFQDELQEKETNFDIESSRDLNKDENSSKSIDDTISFGDCDSSNPQPISNIETKAPKRLKLTQSNQKCIKL